MAMRIFGVAVSERSGIYERSERVYELSGLYQVEKDLYYQRVSSI